MNPYFTSALFITSPSNSWYSGLQVLAVKRRPMDWTSKPRILIPDQSNDRGQMYNTDCGGGAIGTAVDSTPPT